MLWYSCNIVLAPQDLSGHLAALWNVSGKLTTAQNYKWNYCNPWICIAIWRARLAHSICPAHTAAGSLSHLHGWEQWSPQPTSPSPMLTLSWDGRRASNNLQPPSSPCTSTEQDQTSLCQSSGQLALQDTLQNLCRRSAGSWGWWNWRVVVGGTWKEPTGGMNRGWVCTRGTDFLPWLLHLRGTCLSRHTIIESFRLDASLHQGNLTPSLPWHGRCVSPSLCLHQPSHMRSRASPSPSSTTP